MGVVTVAGERFSDNLGDGVIADCLAYLLRRACPDDELRLIDLSMKRRYEPAEAAERRYHPRRGGVTAEIRARLPNIVKDRVRKAAWRRRRPALARFLTEHLEGTDVLIVGGGQLLMDNGLRFPHKLETLTACARALGVPKIVFFGCGVGTTWSTAGRTIMGPVLSGPDVPMIVTRDAESKDHLRRNFPDLRTPISVGGDPALWTAEAYREALDPAPGDDTRPIGLAIMHPRLMRHHVRRVRDAAPRRQIRFWVELVQALRRAGSPCALFTNGAVEDQAFARLVHARVTEHPELSDTPLWSRPVEPIDLVRLVARCRALVAHRLHANIVAYALGVPSVGLVWDTKTVQFGKQTGRTRFFVDAHELSAAKVDRLLAEAIETGIAADEQARVKGVVAEALREVLAVHSF